MTERKYTVKEIDALREACGNKYLYGVYDWRKARGWSRGHTEMEKCHAVEQMVRTHMLAGHVAEDLINSEEH